jgi:hypothetical protein
MLKMRARIGLTEKLREHIIPSEEVTGERDSLVTLPRRSKKVDWDALNLLNKSSRR